MTKKTLNERKQEVITEMARTITEIIKLDAPLEEKRGGVTEVFRMAEEILDKNEIIIAMDMVAEATGNPNVFSDLIPEDAGARLAESGFFVDPEMHEALKKLSEEVYKKTAPMFMHTETIKPIAIMPLEIYNDIITSVNPKLVVDSDIMLKSHSDKKRAMQQARDAKKDGKIQ